MNELDDEPPPEEQLPDWLVGLLRAFDPRWLAGAARIAADQSARSGIVRIARDPGTELYLRVQQYYTENRATLVKEARRYLHSPEDVSEVVQEVMRKVLTRLPELRDPEALGAYLRTAVRNESRTRVGQEIRHREMRFVAASPETELDTLIPDDRPSLEDRVVQNLVMARALAQLSPRERDVMLLVDRDGYTLSDAAGHLGIAVGTAKRCRWNAHRKLRRNEAIRQLRPVA
ncbi:RNA polymerase sigma factor [Amycolatopsis anabasis]|uniref:RNA polymerase sigma factor n=1 Tax=Amycolatopsis anabasis TaxID=1840409 RepID=UPI00131E7484|nr:sigma-70 family RNA polymerase sigma factor [Amycolatopsis anabasis]